MGEKAKKAINEAEISLKSIQTALNDLVQHFQAYSVQKQGRAETAAKIVEHVKKKYPGAADTSVIPSTDQTGQAMLKGYLAMKEKGKGFKKDAQRDLIILDQNLVRGKNALAELDKLIVAKAQKRDAATINPITKVANLVNTKSLGSLRETKIKLTTLFETVNRESIGIRAFFNKTKDT